MIVYTLLRSGLRQGRTYLFVSFHRLALKNVLLTSIREQSLLIIEQPSLTGKQQNRSRHITIMPTTSSRVANLRRQLRLVVLVALASRHLRREDTRRNSVHADLAVFECRRQHAAKVRACRFGGSVGKLAVAGTFQLPADGAHVDDLGGVARGDVAAFCEQRQHGHCHEVLAGHVGLEGLGPLRVFGVEEVLADGVGIGGFGLAVGGWGVSVCVGGIARPGLLTELGVVVSRNTSVVHKQVETMRLLGLEVLCELNSTRLGADVPRKGVQATGTGVVCLDSVLENLLASSCDIHLGPVGNEGLGDHEANASSSSCNDCGNVGDIEEGASG